MYVSFRQCPKYLFLSIPNSPSVEFVVTNVPGSEALLPFGVMSEVFFATCKTLLKGGDESLEEEARAQMMDGLVLDAHLMNESMQRLFNYDGRIGSEIIRAGRITEVMDSITSLVLQSVKKEKNSWQKTFKDDGTTFIEPPIETPVDRACAAVFPVVGLVMGQRAIESASLWSVGGNKSEVKYLLVTALQELGDGAASAATGVFESILASRQSLDFLQEDMVFCLELIDYFSSIIARICGVPEVAQEVAATTTETVIEFKPRRKLSVTLSGRVSSLFTF